MAQRAEYLAKSLQRLANAEDQVERAEEHPDDLAIALENVRSLQHGVWADAYLTHDDTAVLLEEAKDALR